MFFEDVSDAGPASLRPTSRIKVPRRFSSVQSPPPPPPPGEPTPPPKRAARQTVSRRSKRPRLSPPPPPPALSVSPASPVTAPKRRRVSSPADSDGSDPGTIGLRTHKLPPSLGGTRHPNEIDGLLQVVTEVLEHGTQTILARDVVQAKILDAFIEEVTIRLIAMTDVWDAHASLAGGLKRAGKKRQGLRGELVAVRREREEIAREMEMVRRGHEVKEKEFSEHLLQQEFIAEMEELRERVEDVVEDDAVVCRSKGIINRRESVGHWWS
jgi:hypothetical protein